MAHKMILKKKRKRMYNLESKLTKILVIEALRRMSSECCTNAMRSFCPMISHNLAQTNVKQRPIELSYPDFQTCVDN